MPTHINMSHRNCSPPPGLGYRAECEFNGSSRRIGDRDVASHLMCVARAKSGDRCTGKKGLRWGLLQRRFVTYVQDVLSIPVFSWGGRNAPQQASDNRSSEDSETSLRRIWTSMPNLSSQKENEAQPLPGSYQLWQSPSFFNNNVHEPCNNVDDTVNMDGTDDCAEAEESKRTPMSDILVENSTVTRQRSVELKADVEPLLKRSVSLFSLLDVRNFSPPSKSPRKQKHKRDNKKKGHGPQHSVEAQTQVLSRCSSSNSHFAGFNISPYPVARPVC